jgi:hypothetical protein
LDAAAQKHFSVTDEQIVRRMDMATQGRASGDPKHDSTPEKNDWTKPAAMAIPKEGLFQREDGRYGPIFPRTPACYGFTIIAKIIPGREPVFCEYAKNIEKAVVGQPDEPKGPNGETLATGQNSIMMDMNSLVWVSKNEIGKLGGAVFSTSATLPIVNNSFTSSVEGSLSGGGGFADSYYQPLILGWRKKRAAIRAVYGFFWRPQAG